MKAARILAGILVGLVVLIAVGLLAVRVLVNPNDYKARIAAGVKESTGRELILSGDIKLSVFPWIALELGPASLGNPPGFDHEPFLAFNHAAVRVKLLPLLHHQLEIGRVELDGLDLRLRRNAEGHGNWEEPAAGPAEKPDKGRSYGESLKNLAGIRITNGRISYQDIVIDRLSFETGAFIDHGVIPINLSLDANYGGPGKTATMNAKLSLSADQATEQLRFAAVSMSGLASHPGSDRPSHWEFSAPTIEVSLKQQTLGVPSFAMSFLGAQVTGKVSATKILDDLEATGHVKLDPLSLRELLPRIGIAVPRVHDARALAQLAATSDFDYGGQGVKLGNVQVALDDTHLHGSVAWMVEDAGGAEAAGDGKAAADAKGPAADAAKALKFDLAVDHIDLNRYLVGSNDDAPPAKAAPAAGGKADEPMAADGILSIASVHFSTMDFTSVRVTLASHGGLMRLAPIQALIDGGRFTGETTLDDRGPVPLVSMDEHLAGVDIAKLLAQGAMKGRVSGHGNVNLKATARGSDADSLFKTMNGSFDANLADGALEGIDLAFALAQAESLIERQSAASVQNTGRTKFDDFKMSAAIANGVATTKDINIASPTLKVTGQGNVNLPTKALDLALLATVMKAPKTTAAEIPMRVTGSYTDPTVRPDMQALAKGALKQKLEGVLGDKLKGLFGKP
jgi:AsmA protein